MIFNNPQYCVYITHYSGDKMPPFYLGSTSVENIKNGYHGTVTSKKYRKIWNQELIDNPHLFYTTIIRRYYSRKYTLYKERGFQRNERVDVVKSDQYINMSIANVNGMFGMDVSGENNPMFNYKWSDEQRKNHSQKLKIAGQNPETKEKRSVSQKKAQNNLETKLKKSIAQKEAWKNPNNNLKNSAKFSSKKVIFKDYEFSSLKEFSKWKKENSCYNNGPCNNLSSDIIKNLILNEFIILCEAYKIFNYEGIDFKLYPKVCKLYETNKLKIFHTYGIKSGSYNRIYKYFNSFKFREELFNNENLLNILNNIKGHI